MALEQKGQIDSRIAPSADKLELVSSAYPWFAANQAATTAIDIAAAMGLSAGAALTQDVEFGWVTYSVDGDPATGTTLEVVVNGLVVVKHYLTQKGERSLPLSFRFKAGVASNYVRIANESTTNKKSLCLHGLRGVLV